MLISLDDNTAQNPRHTREGGYPEAVVNRPIRAARRKPAGMHISHQMGMKTRRPV